MSNTIEFDWLPVESGPCVFRGSKAFRRRFLRPRGKVEIEIVAKSANDVQDAARLFEVAKQMRSLLDRVAVAPVPHDKYLHENARALLDRIDGKEGE